MNSTNKKIAVVIPHFNAPEGLKKAIEHLKSQVNVEVEIFVRDNTHDNILFTRAINVGLRQFVYSDLYDYVLVLNQDANLYPTCLRDLMSVMQANPSVGIAAPVAISSTKVVNWAGSADAFPWGKHLIFNITQLPQAPYETNWVNGACMLLRTAMVREIGLLDENMRFICSDADYSFTARARGWKCVVVPSAFVEHELSGSSNLSNPWLSKVKLEDQLYFAKKWVTNDLYRALAAEGSSLTPAVIQKAIYESQQQLEYLKAQGV
jgi:GT2 family glycosyltransferase